MPNTLTEQVRRMVADREAKGETRAEAIAAVKLLLSEREVSYLFQECGELILEAVLSNG